MLNNAKEHGFIPGLDGLRAFAILFIASYHFSFNWARGGFLGVDIFFVLSAYLITPKILQSQENEHDFNFINFWKRRIQRLLPAAYTMIVSTVLWVVLFNQELLTKIWGDAAASIFYLTNWWFIFHKLSYFDSFGAPSPFKHLWFLALQEQFFFVWPILLIIGLRFVKKRRTLSVIVFILALCSSLLMGILYNPDVDPSRIYYGTDTRSFELLIGSLLAIVFPIERLSQEKASAKLKNVLNIAGLFTLAVFILSSIFVDEYQSFLYQGGLFLFSLNTAVLIACICHPGTFVGNILSWKPLRWIGTRSYEIYLWHYPIMVLSTPINEIGNPSYLRVSLQLIITCIIAELCYRFIETPIRKLGLRGFFRKYFSFVILKIRKLNMAKKLSIAAGALAIITLIAGITNTAKNENEPQKTECFVTAPAAINTAEAHSDKDSGKSAPEKSAPASDKNNEANSAENDMVSLDKSGVANPAANDAVDSDKKNAAAPSAKNEPASANNTASTSPGKNDATSPAGTNAESSNKKDETNSSVQNTSYKKILAIGDSIMLDISADLKKTYTNITVDGKVSRQLKDAVKLAPSYTDFNTADDAVILELGTNGYFSDKEIDSLLDSFSKAHILLVNTRVPRTWEKTVNDSLKQKAEERDNVKLIDWYSSAIKHPEYFGSDGVHLTSSGCDALTSLIIDALK